MKPVLLCNINTSVQVHLEKREIFMRIDQMKPALLCGLKASE